MKKLYIITAIVCGLAACKPNISPKAPTAGNADFSRYMAFGDSYTAGFADGSQYRSAQENSLAAILAARFKLVGGGDFKQPLLPAESGFPHPKNVLAIAAGCDGIPSLGPVKESNWNIDGDSTRIVTQEPFNNIATPGMRSADFIVQDYIATLDFVKPGELPFARRFYHDLSFSPLQQLQYTRDAIKPTFFTIWLGFFDVFLYAQSGGIGNPSPPGDPSTNDITPEAMFDTNYHAAVMNMVQNGAKGVLINVPDILDMPYFNTIPLNDNNGNRFYMTDGATVRQIKDGEMLLLEMPVDSLKCAHWGTQAVPIPGRWVLSLDEIGYVRTAIAQFNSFIEAEAKANGLAFVDINAYLKSIEPGVMVNGVSYSPKFVEGGAYSLDGLHFTPRGYALIANQVINAINSKYGGTLPQADVNKYRGVLFP